MKTIRTLFFIGLITVGLVSFRQISVGQSSTSLVRPHTVADTLKIDPESGLIEDANLIMVKGQCTACHSSKLILQHRFTRAGWLDRIRWMQKYHNLWDLGESEKVVLDYLETYYGPESAAKARIFRRAPIKPVEWYKLD